MLKIDKSHQSSADVIRGFNELREAIIGTLVRQRSVRKKGDLAGRPWSNDDAQIADGPPPVETVVFVSPKQSLRISEWTLRWTMEGRIVGEFAIPDKVSARLESGLGELILSKTGLAGTAGTAKMAETTANLVPSRYIKGGVVQFDYRPPGTIPVPLDIKIPGHLISELRLYPRGWF